MYNPIYRPRSWRNITSAISLFNVSKSTTKKNTIERILVLTIGPRVSPGPAPIPERIHAPMKELYDVAVALQIQDPIPIVVDTSNIGRRPNARATGTQIKLEKPKTRMQIPI